LEEKRVLRILVLTKRQYMSKDLLDDRFGRFREIPLALGQRGHDVRGLCLSYKRREEGQTWDGNVLWTSVNATCLKLPGLASFIRHAHRMASHADGIWACSDSFYGIIGHVLSRKYGLPFVFDLYDNFEYYLAASLPTLKQLYRSVVRNCDGVTCISRPLADLVRSYGRSGLLVVLENAVRKDLFKPLEKDLCRKRLNLSLKAPLIGTAGALFRNRGIHTLLNAFRELKPRHPDLHLVLAGPRDIAIPPWEGVVDLGVLPLDQVPVLLNALDVAVICNRKNDFGRYCFPQKAREIMACQVPVVAARVGSMEELFSPHPSWLYVPESAPSLADALERRLKDRDTGYGHVPEWYDLALELEKIFFSLTGRR
jgi:teichuronic acid biosynthesis glycosyltransferase TuaC